MQNYTIPLNNVKYGACEEILKSVSLQSSVRNFNVQLTRKMLLKW